MEQIMYPFDKIHSFYYKFDENKNLFKDIINSPIDKLYNFKIESDRFDTIREGSYIFLRVLEYLNAKNIITK